MRIQLLLILIITPKGTGFFLLYARADASAYAHNMDMNIKILTVLKETVAFLFD